MKSNNYQKIDLMEIEQDGRFFYLGKVNIKDFGRLTTANPMEYKACDEQVIDIKSDYFSSPKKQTGNQHYQRAKNESRVNEIAQYLRTADERESVIPNTILLSVKAAEIESPDELKASGEDIYFMNGSSPAMYVKNELFTLHADDTRAKKFFIIDGNHRVNGIMKYIEETGTHKFEMPVSILVNKEKRHEAEIFKTVNYESKPVNKSYYYQIIGDFGLGTEEEQFLQKATEIFNTHQDSPFRGLIKMLGTPYEHENRQAFSQSFFIEQLNEWLLMERSNVRILDYYGVYRLPVLSYYFKRDKDVTFKLLWEYFSTIKDLFEEKYGEGTWFNYHNQPEGNDYEYKANYLLKSVGIGAFIELFPIVFMKMLGDMSMIERQDEILVEGTEVLKFKEYLRVFFDEDYSVQDHIKDQYTGASGQGLVRRFAEEILQTMFVPSFEYSEDERAYLNWYQKWM